MNSGPRIVLNDIKPPGRSKDNPDFYMKTSYAVNLERDKGPGKSLVSNANSSHWEQTDITGEVLNFIKKLREETG